MITNMHETKNDGDVKFLTKFTNSDDSKVHAVNLV